VREIFPFLNQAQIIQEIRGAQGNIEQAILNITSNLEREQYAGQQQNENMDNQAANNNQDR